MLVVDSSVWIDVFNGFEAPSAEHDRQLYGRGQTVCSAIDMLVAAFCIERDYALLHDDREFDAFELHRRLRVWRH